MVKLTFYGGVNEIGGNKILLEDDSKRLLLDFGFPYKKHKRFYEEYLKPRPGAGLLDPLTMGLLPPIEGLYRDDLNTSGLWNRFKMSPLYSKLDAVDGVLLTHAHLDHSAHISFLPQIIVRNGGSDPHFNDGLTNLGLSVKGFRMIGEKVSNMANICNGKVIDLIASGYNREVLPYAWLALVCGLAGIGLEIQEPEPMPQRYMSESAFAETEAVVEEVKNNLKSHWACLR